MLSSGSGAWQPQRTAISINGTVSPAANTIKTMAGQAITTGTSFKVALPPYSMTWLKIPLTGGVTTQPERKSFLQASQTPSIRCIGAREFSIALTGANALDGKWTIIICDMAGKKVGERRSTSAYTTVKIPGTGSGIFFFVTNKGGITFTNAVIVR
jgi:hypothetical protein